MGRKPKKYPSRSEYIQDLKALAAGGSCTVRHYREESKLPERGWLYHFGSWGTFKAAAGLGPSGHDGKLRRQIVRVAQASVYRDGDKDRLAGQLYRRKNGKREQIVMGVSDLHDMEADPFFVRVVREVAATVQPDIINFTGDILDLPQFSRFDKDQREPSITERAEWLDKEWWGPLREACPDAQFDLIEGNHEYRLCKYIYSRSPEMAELLDLRGVTVAQLFNLPTYEINYIAKGTLQAYSQADQRREQEKSVLTYFNKALLVSHYPSGRKEQIPGWNGHHHVHRATPMKNGIYGEYEWHQLGGGHRRSAIYCDGTQWANGFILAHVDTQTKRTNFEYVQVGDRAVCHGKYYYRRKNEEW